ncbi:hypothetical protein FOZ62_024895 [Perkinsus olseni]|uniref:Uncharacterized protein n=1 Tax=Perkinsus olseni TaxID=32597 RepID=A0A7J6S995_PEROL|nr:hypothetical protein FOZ62_024895 [Perkinsus olseni]
MFKATGAAVLPASDGQDTARIVEDFGPIGDRMPEEPTPVGFEEASDIKSELGGVLTGALDPLFRPPCRFPELSSRPGGHLDTPSPAVSLTAVTSSRVDTGCASFDSSPPPRKEALFKGMAPPTIEFSTTFNGQLGPLDHHHHHQEDVGRGNVPGAVNALLPPASSSTALQDPRKPQPSLAIVIPAPWGPCHVVNNFFISYVGQRDSPVNQAPSTVVGETIFGGPSGSFTSRPAQTLPPGNHASTTSFPDEICQCSPTPSACSCDDRNVVTNNFYLTLPAAPNAPRSFPDAPAASYRRRPRRPTACRNFRDAPR